jgi:hypothetical protein
MGQENDAVSEDRKTEDGTEDDQLRDDQLRVECPGCRGELIIDIATSQVLVHKAARQAPAGGKDLDSLFADLDESKQRADDIFDREMSALKDKDRILEEKFRLGLERAEKEPDEKPLRPWDLD